MTAVVGCRQSYLTLARALEMDGNQTGAEEIGRNGKTENSGNLAIRGRGGEDSHRKEY